MKMMIAVSAWSLGCLLVQAADMTLAEKDIGLNAYVSKEIEGSFKERPKDLPSLDAETILGWVKSAVKLDPEQLRKVEALKAKLRVRMETYKRLLMALSATSDRMAQVKNEREQKRLQEEAMELHERLQKEFPSPTASIVCNPLADVTSWLNSILSEEQQLVWRSEVLKRFGELASTVTIEKTNKEVVTGKLLARRFDYDFGKNLQIKSYLVLAGDKILYVAPTEVAQTADHQDAVRIAPSGKGDRR